MGDVQQDLLKIVAAETLLVGHSLENDLHQTHLLHGNILDTANMYPHPRGPPYRLGLRALSEQHLERKIQVRGRAYSYVTITAAITPGWECTEAMQACATPA